MGRQLNDTNLSTTGNVIASMVNEDGKAQAKQRAVLVDWINSILPNLNLPAKASDEDLRTSLADGIVLCRILNRLRRGFVTEGGTFDYSSVSPSENIRRFLATMDELGMPRFEISELEKGSMKTVVDCLLTLKAQPLPVGGNSSTSVTTTKSGSPQADASPRGLLSPLSDEEKMKFLSDSKFQRALRTPLMSEQSAASKHQVGHKFHEVFQLRQGRYADLPAAKISEMMKSNSLDNAPTQSLLSVVNGILDESIERKNDEIPHRVACLLRKVVQEIERRISTQAEHLRTQNNLFKAREEKYQSRIRVLEALASGTGEKAQAQKPKVEEQKKLEEKDMVKLMKERDQYTLEISALKHELEVAKNTHEKHCLMKERDQYNLEISALKQELEVAKNTHEKHCLQMEIEAKGAKSQLESRLKELECLLADANTKVKEIEAHSDSKCQKWSKKEHNYKRFMDFHIGALRELRFSSESIKQEFIDTQKSNSEDFDRLGVVLKLLARAAENFDAVFAENQKMFNELQDLKGNIRVYCRIRPFLPGQTAKRTTVEHIGEYGELIVANPTKPGKDGYKSFKFNKVFGPDATQVDVFSDIQPLIRSVLDGYNVCIFAYGQTGSGKTYTMTGPNRASEEDWGVNYRSLNDLFKISQSRRSFFIYEIGVQMVEIYNEQVRDLLSNDVAQKKLGIMSTTQPNGLAVPDASMHAVRSTSDVLELMDIGLKNRAIGATALNERSSRSHSVVTVHVRGKDLKTGSGLHGNLHLVDLAGSERVDRSEVTGDRLKEAQHINKSLSALGDVIFALAQKGSHVPYRNSKLTQVLQSSLGGQAKTLMFVQLNPDANSYSESMSTLKFAERVSGVELGAARSSKEVRDVKELMEQVASLKDTIAKKDEEIERLQLLKDLKNVYPGINGEKHMTSTLRYQSSSPNRDIVGGTPQPSQKPSGGKGFGLTEKAASDSIKRSEADSNADSQQSMDDYKHQNDYLRQSKVARGDIGQIIHADAEILGLGDGDYQESLSDISDSSLSVGTEPDGSVEYTPLPEGKKQSDNMESNMPVSKISRNPSKPATVSAAKDSSKVSTNCYWQLYFPQASKEMAIN
ncbi:Kinesin domain-containing protein/CH domain-containing protein [Cephalotus follicularis]|uniref:Kinesin domain-containing protein/CH domain-containing protein n=1 Tax=Cephalotus follicularis TaxID=3775 RepID=A0A1Q3BGT0_CEPFO|nr:Kinesin domain-containing protein/CH domain-containing protein [Cephalotus follicularis]